MRLSLTLSRYIVRQFFLGVAIVFGALAVVTLLADTIEILRKASDAQAPFSVLIGMAWLKFPLMVQRLIPYAVLFGSVLTFLKLTRTRELVIARASGISAWQFLLPAVLGALALGVFVMTVWNPLACIVLQRYEKLEGRYLSGRASLLSVSSSGLWLRQRNLEPGSHKEVLIHALRSSGSQNVELHDVIIFTFSGTDQFAERIDARSASLQEGYWELKDVIITYSTRPSERRAIYRLKTELTPSQIQESFAAPETISFWALPGFIQALTEAGFSALRHRMHWHQMLALPVVLAAMVLIAAIFALHSPQRAKISQLMAACILTGFAIYFGSDLLTALGISGELPVMLAAWGPGIIALLLGAGALLHFEDG